MFAWIRVVRMYITEVNLLFYLTWNVLWSFKKDLRNYPLKLEIDFERLTSSTTFPFQNEYYSPLPRLINCLTRNLPSSRLNNNNISYRRIKCSTHQILPCFFIEEKYDFIKVQACQCVWYSLTLTVVYTYRWIYIAYHQLSCSLIM